LRARAILVSALACLLLPACGGGGGGPGDAGADGQEDGLDGGADPGPDADPALAFRLVVPEGARLCPGFMEGRDHLGELAMQSQVELRPGILVLPREAGDLAVPNPVVRVRMRAGDEELSSAPAEVQGEVAAQDPDGPWGRYRYTLRVPLSRAQGTAELDLHLEVSRLEGAWPSEITVGAEPASAWLSAELRLDGGEDWATERARYAPCELAGPPARTIQASSASGAAVELELRQGPWYDSCFASGETACYFLTRASYARGAHRADIADRWRLVYNGSHHNWNDRYLVLLDPPDGDVRAALVLSPDFFTHEGAALVLLDAALQELAREALTTWEQGP